MIAVLLDKIKQKRTCACRIAVFISHITRLKGDFSTCQHDAFRAEHGHSACPSVQQSGGAIHQKRSTSFHVVTTFNTCESSLYLFDSTLITFRRYVLPPRRFASDTFWYRDILAPFYIFYLYNWIVKFIYHFVGAHLSCSNNFCMNGFISYFVNNFYIQLLVHTHFS